MLQQYDRFGQLLDHARAAYQGHDATRSFADFPDDLAPQQVMPFHIPASDLMLAENGLFTGDYAALRDAIFAAAPSAHWRETYKGTDIGQDFLDRFGCYSIIGNGGGFHSDKLWMWIVYMPPHLHYPWHHHPGEELYLVLAGQADFHRQGTESETLGPGGAVFHASNQSHAMTTGEHPVLCLVAWRNGFDTAPVLSEV